MNCGTNTGHEDDDNLSIDSTESTTTASPTQASKTDPQCLFTPTVFTVSDGKTPFSVMPLDLTQSVRKEDLTVEHLSLTRFWSFIEKEVDANPRTHRLLAFVPNVCGQLAETRDMKDSIVWHAEMTRCHNAGWVEVQFQVWVREDAPGCGAGGGFPYMWAFVICAVVVVVAVTSYCKAQRVADQDTMYRR